MNNDFDVSNSSLESSVKAYHRRVIEPFIEDVGNLEGLSSIMGKLITKDNIGEQSVNYANSAGSVEWSSIKNIPPDLTSSDPGFSTNHNHANKETLDKLSTDSDGNILYGGKLLITQEEYTIVKDMVDVISEQQTKCITSDNIGEQSVNYANSAGSVEWGSVENKPSSFTPEEHNHTISDITDFPESMPASDVPDWAKTETKPTYSWSEIQGKPESYPSEFEHTHSNKTVLDNFSEDTSGNILYKGNVIQSPGEDPSSLINDTSVSETQTYSSQKIEEILGEVEDSVSVDVSSESNNALEMKSDGLYVSSETITGENGKSAYEIWLELGNDGTEQDFIDSLKGADGTTSDITFSIDENGILCATYDDGVEE